MHNLARFAMGVGTALSIFTLMGSSALGVEFIGDLITPQADWFQILIEYSVFAILAASAVLLVRNLIVAFLRFIVERYDDLSDRETDHE